MGLVCLMAALALLMALILRWSVHPFLALLISALGLAIGAGMDPAAALLSMTKGIGDLVGSIAVIIGAGAILGRLIEVSGGGAAVAEGLIAIFGPRRLSVGYAVHRISRGYSGFL